MSILDSYRNIKFSEETPDIDYYTFSNIKELCKKCEDRKEDVILCRTVGMLLSEYGNFYINEMDDETGLQCQFRIQLSLLYVTRTLPSTVTPYPVQVFGSMQWRNRPVIMVKLIQVMNLKMAIKIKEIMNIVVSRHLARRSKDDEEVIEDSIVT